MPSTQALIHNLVAFTFSAGGVWMSGAFACAAARRWKEERRHEFHFKEFMLRQKDPTAPPPALHIYGWSALSLAAGVVIYVLTLGRL